MRAGQYRHPVTIQNYTTSQDANGNITRSWSTFSSWRARIEPIRGREYFEAKSIVPEQTYRFSGWFVSGVTQDMRIKDEDGNLYDIQDVLPDSNSGRHTMQIMAIRTNEESV